MIILQKIVSLCFLLHTVISVDTDMSRSFAEICHENGFLFESHKVTTADGYINTMFRIKGTIADKNSKEKRPPVFLMHGIFDSADAFIMNWSEVAPPFVLARNGYDVWLGNSRGNKYSLEHENLSSKDN